MTQSIVRPARSKASAAVESPRVLGALRRITLAVSSAAAEVVASGLASVEVADSPTAASPVDLTEETDCRPRNLKREKNEGRLPVVESVLAVESRLDMSLPTEEAEAIEARAASDAVDVERRLLWSKLGARIDGAPVYSLESDVDAVSDDERRAICKRV